MGVERTSPTPQRGRGHARSLALVARALAWVLIFAIALAVSVWLHLDTQPLRSAVSTLVNRALQGSFRGRVELQEIERIGAFGAAAGALRVFDESGSPVLELSGVKLGYAPLELLRALRSPPGAEVTIAHVRVEEARVVLVMDEATEQWTLLRALSKPPRPRPKRSRAAVTYVLESIELGKVELLFQHPSVGEIVGRVDHVRGSAELGGADSSVSVERFGVRLVGPERFRLDGTGSFKLLPQAYVAGAFHGFLDGVELDAGAVVEDGIINLRLDVPRASPAEVRARLPSWPLAVPLALELRAHGPPAQLELDARLRALDSTLSLSGKAGLTPEPNADLKLAARALDARIFELGLPPTNLALDGTLRVKAEAAGASAHVAGRTEPTTLLGVDVPALEFSLRAEPESVAAEVRGTDARGSVEASVTRAEGGGMVFAARARELKLGALPGVHGRITGTADLTAEGRLSAGRFSLAASGDLRDVHAPAAALASGRVEVSAQGDLNALSRVQIETHLDGSQLSLGGLSFARARWESRGPWQRNEFGLQLERDGSGGGSGSASGVLALTPSLEVSGLELAGSAPAFSALARVNRWNPELGELDLETLEVSGAVGSLRASGKLARKRLRAAVSTEQLDLALLSRTLELDFQGVSGRASGVAELTLEDASDARLDMSIEGFALRDVALGELRLRGRLDAHHLEATLANADSPLGQLELKTRLALAGHPLEVASWRHATGDLTAKLQQLPLWPVGLALANQVPIEDLDGQVAATLEIERRDPMILPDVFFHAQTPQLAFAVAPRGAEGTRRQFDDFRLHASASIAGASGHGAATVAITDQHGQLITTSGSIELELEAMLAEPASALRRLLQAPLDVLLRLHPRQLALLPPPLSVRDLTGSVEASLLLRGTLDDPTLELVAEGQQLLGSVSDAGRAVDITTYLQYAPESGELLGHADAVQGGKRLVVARLQGRAKDPLAAPDALQELELHAAAMLNGVPLELWPAAARNEVEALLYGSLALETRGGRTQQRGHIELGGLAVAGHPFGNGQLRFDNRGELLHAQLRLGSNHEHLEVEIEGSTAALPGAERAPIHGSLTARNFDAASLTPLVRGILSGVSGAMTGDLKFTARPGPEEDWYLGIDGDAELRDGAAQLDLFGLDLRELTGHIRARSTPEYTVIQIEPVSARARSRRPNFSGNAELWLKGFRVVDGEATLSLDEVPLTLEGATRGTARGQLRTRLERHPDHMALEVKIPELRLQLPSSPTRSLIDLEANPDVQVLQASEPDEPADRDPMAWKMRFELGEDVRVQRADLNVPLTGSPRLEYAAELRPSGTIEALPGGHVILFDQRFSIDRAVIQLVPAEPGNPRVDITASWRAPDGTTVYVDITGSAKHASVLTRDDRGLQDVERFYLLTGSTARPEAGPGATASGSGEGAVLGQTVALGVNELLRESLGNVAVSVGTRDDRASYSASVRLSDKVTFEGRFQPGSENNLEQSTNDLTGTLDYRFSRSWSLRTELGTSGGAFDLLWSHRY